MDKQSGKARHPDTAFALVIAAVSAMAIPLTPEFGVLSLFIMAGGVMFTVSSRTNPFILLIPAAAVPFLFYRAPGFDAVTAMYVFIAAAVSGAVLRHGGRFHTALMAFIATAAVLAAASAVTVFEFGGADLADLAPAVRKRLLDFVQSVVYASPNALTEEQAATLIDMYKNLADYIVMYIPAMLGVAAGLLGALSLRLCGFIHTVAADEAYPMSRRQAVVSRTFAVLYLIATLLFAAGGDGVVGLAAGNIVLFLSVPATAAGITAFRRDLAPGATLSRFRTFFIVLSVIFVFVSPGLIVILLSLLGVFAAFGKAPGNDGKEGT